MNPMCCNPIRILVYMWITFLLNKTSAHEQCPVAELRTRESHWSFCANNSHFCLYDISKRKADIHVRRGVRRGFFLQIFSKHSVRLKHMHVCMKKKVCKYIHHGTAHMCKVFFNTIEKKSDLSVWMLNFFLLIELFHGVCCISHVTDLCWDWISSFPASAGRTVAMNAQRMNVLNPHFYPQTIRAVYPVRMSQPNAG